MTSLRLRSRAATDSPRIWWFANNELHSGNVKGPFPNGDRFTVIFNYDVTPKAGPMAGQRMQMEEVGLYTVEGGKMATASSGPPVVEAPRERAAV